MLSEVEMNTASRVEPLTQEKQAVQTEWLAELQRKRPVWVYSKSQPPYQFYPWLDPCVPHEWPYDLQALRGTEDYTDIIEWYLSRHPQVPRADLLLFESELARCTGNERQISVEAYNDIDTGKKGLEFTVWGFAPDDFGLDSVAIKAFRAERATNPALAALWQVVSVWTMSGRFEDRDQ